MNLTIYSHFLEQHVQKTLFHVTLNSFSLISQAKITREFTNRRQVAFDSDYKPTYLYFQNSRQVLYDAKLVNSMIADVEAIDLSAISSQALYTSSDMDQDTELNAECKILY